MMRRCSDVISFVCFPFYFGGVVLKMFAFLMTMTPDDADNDDDGFLIEVITDAVENPFMIVVVVGRG